MINILLKTPWLEKQTNIKNWGFYQRIIDLSLFMKNNNILHTIDNNINIKNNFNIFSSLIAFENMSIDDFQTFAIMLCVTFIPNMFMQRYNILLKEHNIPLITHNAYKSYCFRYAQYDSIFIPMFLYNYNLPQVNSTTYKYKYGITLDNKDCMLSYLSLLSTMGFFNSALLLTRNENIGNDSNIPTTQDKQQFFNECESIMLFTDKYVAKHVGSRFVFECIYLRKPLYVLCPDVTFVEEPTLKQFNSLTYDYIDGFKKFSIWQVQNAKPNLVMYDTYNTYILNLLHNIEDRSFRQQIPQYMYAEEYIT